MSTLPIHDRSGAKVSEYTLDEALLADKGDPLVHAEVVAHQARARGGNASTKTRGEVAGSNRKPWRQKGTGRARSGERTSPIWRGGGIIFGPRPRDYGYKLPKQAARLAFRKAFSDRVREGAVRVVESLAPDEPRTKVFAALVEAVRPGPGPVLCVVAAFDDALKRASRNLPKVAVVPAAQVSTFDLVKYRNVVVAQDALPILETRLGRRGRSPS